MAPGMGTTRYLWWSGGGTSGFNSCPVCGQIHTISVRLRQGLLATALESLMLQALRIFSFHLPRAWTSGFALCPSAPCSTSVINACGVHHSPVLADTDQYSACISLARCTASASACSHAAADWKKGPWLTRYLGPLFRESLGWPPLSPPLLLTSPEARGCGGVSPGQAARPELTLECFPREMSHPAS